jgi:hypothetical protein
VVRDRDPAGGGHRDGSRGGPRAPRDAGDDRPPPQGARRGRGRVVDVVELDVEQLG